jgi:hypothetical protein
MRIPTYSPSLLPVDNTRRIKDLLVDPPTALPQHYPQQQPATRPLAERVVEGEILPRPLAAESLLANYHANTLTQAANRHVSAAAANPAQTTSTSQVLFYLLHSSNETLSGLNAGQYVDQRV